jgi:hypothetical protein
MRLKASSYMFVLCFAVQVPRCICGQRQLAKFAQLNAALYAAKGRFSPACNTCAPPSFGGNSMGDSGGEIMMRAMMYPPLFLCVFVHVLRLDIRGHTDTHNVL